MDKKTTYVFNEENTQALKEHFKALGDDYFPDEVDIMVLKEGPACNVIVTDENLQACGDALWDS